MWMRVNQSVSNLKLSNPYKPINKRKEKLINNNNNNNNIKMLVNNNNNNNNKKKKLLLKSLRSKLNKLLKSLN